MSFFQVLDSFPFFLPLWWYLVLVLYILFKGHTLPSICFAVALILIPPWFFGKACSMSLGLRE